MSFFMVFITVIEMCSWRKSEEEPEGHSAMSATTKWVQFKLQNIHQGLSLIAFLMKMY